MSKAKKGNLYCLLYGRGGGFTFLELFVALTILVILAGFAIPKWGSLLPVFRLRGAARQLKAEFGRIKMQAASENSRIRLVFSQRTYSTERRDGAVYRSMSGDIPLPVGIDIRSTTRRRLGFTARGTATPGTGGTVKLCNVKAEGANVVVSSTGRIRICIPDSCNGTC